MTIDTSGLSQEQTNFLESITNQYINGFGLLNKVQGKRATIYGGHAILPESPSYQETYQIGKLLAERGFTILNGGGPGMMEAATSGAESVAGDTIAITMDIPNEPPQEIADVRIETTIFSVRKYLLNSSDVLVYVPGGWGTLDELAEVVILSRFHKIPAKQIFLYDKEFWSEFHNWVADDLVNKWKFVSPDYLNIFKIVDSPEELVSYLI